MWAITKEVNSVRHLWGGLSQANTLCGKQGDFPLDYINGLHLPKCEECIQLEGKVIEDVLPTRTKESV